MAEGTKTLHSPVWDVNEWLYHPPETIYYDDNGNVLTADQYQEWNENHNQVNIPAGGLYEVLKGAERLLSPFFPVQSQPESMVPFFRYIVRGSSRPDMWYLKTDSITYILYDDNYDRAVWINNVLTEILGREDESAEEINLYYDLPGKHTEYMFHACVYNATLTPEAPNQEAGTMKFVTVIDIDYTPKRIRGLFY